MKGYRLSVSIALVLCDVTENMIFVACVKLRVKIHVDISMAGVLPIGSMYAIFGNIYHQYTPNVSIYTIQGSYGLVKIRISPQRRLNFLIKGLRKKEH